MVPEHVLITTSAVFARTWTKRYDSETRLMQLECVDLDIPERPVHPEGNEAKVNPTSLIADEETGRE